MLEELHISNLAVIEDTTLFFHGMDTALVGETGAGKSLIVTSLNLLLGERVDYSLVRDKNRKAIISGVFSLSEDFLSKQDGVKEYVEGNTLILKRVLNPDHSARHYINGTPVSAQEMKGVSLHLIDIHSQNANSDLLDEKKQLSYVYGFLSKEGRKAKEAYEKSYASYRKAKREKEDFLSSCHDIDLDYLTFQIHEIEKYQLKENEIENLNEEYASLADYAKLESKFSDYESVKEGNGYSLTSSLSEVRRKLGGFKGTCLEKECESSIDAIDNLEEKLSALEDAFSSLDFSPRRIDEINARLYELKTLQRKFGRTTTEILEKYNEFKTKLEFANSFSEKKAEYEDKERLAYDCVLKNGEALHLESEKARERLTKEIDKNLVELGLRKNGFFVRFEKRNTAESDGLYSAVFEVQLNEGIERATLRSAASGGETSRLMLALKAVLNQVNPYDLLVFDEIDTGVSGKQALLVAKKIRELSKTSQVLVISHLPQVVASATEAIYISKTVKDGKTATEAKTLSEEEFLLFIGRMLSASTLTDAAKEQAKELRKEFL